MTYTNPPLPKTSRSRASFGLRVCGGWWGSWEDEVEDEDEEPLSLIISLFLICSMGVSSVIMETNWRNRRREDSILKTTFRCFFFKNPKLVHVVVNNKAMFLTLPILLNSNVSTFKLHKIWGHKKWNKIEVLECCVRKGRGGQSIQIFHERKRSIILKIHHSRKSSALKIT